MFLHQADAYPFPVLRANDWAMLCSINRETLFGHAGVRFVRDFDDRSRQRTLFVAVLVIDPIALLHDGLEIFVDRIDGARGMHPATVFVESLVDKELSPGDRAVRVEAFTAGHLQF